MTLKQTFLNVYVLWHPGAAAGRRYADSLFTMLSWDVKRPFAREIGIPTFFRSVGTSAQQDRPARIDLDAAEHSVVVALTESHLVDGEPWVTMLHQLRTEADASQGRHELMIVPIDGNGGRLPPALTTRLYAVTSDAPDARKLQEVREHVAVVVTRVVEGRGGRTASGVKLFISHTKRDERSLELARSIKTELAAENRPTRFFFDATEIKATDEIKEKVEEAVAESTLLAVRTDAYSGSPWCNLEVLVAKRHDRPIVVLDALNARDDRQLPALGNVPCVRLADAKADDKEAQAEAVRNAIEAAVVETMRFHYVHRKLDHLRKLGRLPKGATLKALPPEERDLRRLGAKRKAAVLVYPDPPLPLCEQEDLKHPRVTLMTPLTAADVDLSKRVIGLSVADPEEDLMPLGLVKAHVSAALDLMARALLSKQATVAFGGDLRQDGFTDFLAELVRAHNATERGSYKPIRNFLPWPKHVTLSQEERSARVQCLKITCVEPPQDIAADPAVEPAQDTAEGRYLWARGMTAMRETMTEKVCARVALGGKVSGFKGAYPGIVEEVLLCLRVEKPVFLLGGFGGAASRLAQLLDGGAWGWPDLDLKAGFKAEYEEMVAYHNRMAANDDRVPRVDLDGVLKEIRSFGIKGLNNGLSKSENRRLFSTQDIEEAAWLVLQGLSRRWRSGNGRG